MQALLRRVGLARDDASDLLRALPDARRRPLVLELGLFKTGTTAIADYFRCNGWARSHNVCKARGNETTACVRCMGRFLEAAAWAGIGRGPTNGGVFATAGDVDLGPTFRRLCGPYDVFAELGHLTATTCFLPQVEHLRTLVRVLPNACFVLNTRELGGWMRSVSAWVGHEQVHFRGVTLLKRALSNCPIWPRTAEGPQGLPSRARPARARRAARREVRHRGRPRAAGGGDGRAAGDRVSRHEPLVLERGQAVAVRLGGQVQFDSVLGGAPQAGDEGEDSSAREGMRG